MLPFVQNQGENVVALMKVCIIDSGLPLQFIVLTPWTKFNLQGINSLNFGFELSQFFFIQLFPKQQPVKKPKKQKQCLLCVLL